MFEKRVLVPRRKPVKVTVAEPRIVSNIQVIGDKINVELRLVRIILLKIVVAPISELVVT